MSNSHQIETRTYAYTLVTDGKEQAQERAALINRNVSRLFQDWTPNPNAPRPEFDLLKLFLQPGDTLIVWKVDRLGLEAPERLAFFEWLHDQQITLECLTEAVTLAGLISNLEYSLQQSDPMDGDDKASLRHLCELEARACKLAKDLEGTEAAAQAENVKAMAGDVRRHLSFIAQQIRYGDHAAALGRINEIASDF